MAVTEWIAAGAAAADAALETTGNIVAVANDLVGNQRIVIKFYDAAGGVEQVRQEGKELILTQRNNAVQLVGPCKYHAYKDATAATAGLAYYP